MKKIYLFNDIPFHRITKKELIRKIITSGKKGERKLILNMNVHGVTTYLKDEKYSKIMNKADIIYSDGWGPVWASRFFKEKLSERVNVGDFIDELLDDIQENRLNLYLLGGESKNLKKTWRTIKIKYPRLNVVGYSSGFFSKRDEPKIIKMIRNTHPNIVLVGMGLPKQEFWINDNWGILPSAVYMGVGSVFEYIGGKKRAPMLMREYGLEWLYRFFQEPRRLWKRYTLDNLFFIYVFLKSLIKS